MMSAATTQHTSSNTDDSQKKMSCWDVLSKTEIPYTTPSSPTDDKDNEKYLIIISTVLSQVISRGDKVMYRLG